MKGYAKSLKSARFPEVVLEYYGDGDRVKVRQLILVERPDSIRIQTRIPASNEILNMLVSRGGQFATHDRRTNKYYSGPSTAENVSRLLPVDLVPADLVEVMLGGAPWQKIHSLAVGSPEITWDGDKGVYQYGVGTVGGGRISVFVDPKTFATLGVTQFDATDGAATWTYQAEKWQNFGSKTTTEVKLPTYRRFLMPSKSIDFSLETEKVELNPQLPDILFELQPPEGSTTVTFN